MEHPLRRSTVYLDPVLHKALKLKAAEQERALSDLVNEAVRLALSEDDIDLRAVRARRNEPTRTFAAFLKTLKRDAKI
ncbi:MAG: CopG family transcriptional regulator [Deltaproteobacteria bacterium]|nr:CopG family transcriptional regulator [Deltaproteobacteria bacterium]